MYKFLKIGSTTVVEWHGTNTLTKEEKERHLPTKQKKIGLIFKR
jgi:hypothetical protein